MAWSETKVEKTAKKEERETRSRAEDVNERQKHAELNRCLNVYPWRSFCSQGSNPDIPKRPKPKPVHGSLIASFLDAL